MPKLSYVDLVVQRSPGITPDIGLVEVRMVTISKDIAHAAVTSASRGRHATANPARRGPVVLATDGASRSGAVVAIAQLIASRLDVPLEVVSVLEPTPIYAEAQDGIAFSDGTIDEARRDARETLVSDYVGRFAEAWEKHKVPWSIRRRRGWQDIAGGVGLGRRRHLRC